MEEQKNKKYFDSEIELEFFLQFYNEDSGAVLLQNDLIIPQVFLNEICTRRNSRLDFVFPFSKTIIECQGGIWLEKSGHKSADGMVRDMHRVNMAQILGWNLYQINRVNLANEEFMQLLRVNIHRKTVRTRHTVNSVLSVVNQYDDYLPNLKYYENDDKTYMVEYAFGVYPVKSKFLLQ